MNCQPVRNGISLQASTKRQLLLSGTSRFVFLAVSVAVMFGVTLPQEAGAVPVLSKTISSGATYTGSDGYVFDGGSGYSASLTNHGTLTGTATSGKGAKVTSYAPAGYAALTNDGSVTATGTSGTGAYVYGYNGSVTNQSGGAISGATGVKVYGSYPGGTSSLTNAGNITGTSTNRSGAVVGGYNASATNQSGGNISGGTGVKVLGVISGGTTSLTNAGTITGTNTNRSGAYVYGYNANVTNQAGGNISGGAGATIISGTYLVPAGTSSLTNAGNISGTSASGPAALLSGFDASVINQSGATISGAIGVVIGADYYGGTATLTNSGTIATTSADGPGAIVFGYNASVTNQSGSQITGGYGVVIHAGDYYVAGGTASLTNAGTITGTAAYGVGALVSGFHATIDNQSGGAISGGYGVVLQSGSYYPGNTASLTNAGTITGTNGVGVLVQLYGYVPGQSTVTNSGTIGGTAASVVFDGLGAHTLILQTGSVLNGTAYGSTTPGATTALVLEGTGVANNDFADFTSLSVQATGTWTLGGTVDVATADIASGTLIIEGTVNASGDVTNEAALQIGGAGAGLLSNGTFTQTGGSTLLGGGTLQGSNGIIVNGGLIGGTGTLIGDVVVTNGTVQVGASPDMLHIAGDFTEHRGLLTFEIDPDGVGGFLTSWLEFDPGYDVLLDRTHIAFNFLNGADPLAFFLSGLFDFDTFFRLSSSDVFSADFDLSSVFLASRLTLNDPRYRILGFDPTDGAIFLASVPEPGSLAVLLAGLAGFAGMRRRARKARGTERIGTVVIKPA